MVMDAVLVCYCIDTDTSSHEETVDGPKETYADESLKVGFLSFLVSQPCTFSR